MKKILLIQTLIFAAFFSASAQNFEWAKGIQGDVYNSGESITYDAAGNSYIAGRFFDTVDFDPGAGVFNLTSGVGSDIYILKLDALGDFVWAKSIGGTSEDRPSSIHVDEGGDIYVTGFFSDTVDFDPGVGVNNLISEGFKDIFVLKLNSFGDFVWAKQFGGTANDEGYDITVDVNRFVYVTGTFSGTADFDPGAGTSNLISEGAFDGFVLKLLPSGDLNWVKKVGGPNDDDASFSIDLDSSNNVYTTGYFRDSVDFDPGAGTANVTSNGMRDGYILKFDGAGNYVWVKTIGSFAQDYVRDITIDDATGDVFVTGEFQFTVDFDPGTDTANLVSNGILDAYVLKLNANGDYVWAKSYGGDSFENSTSISLDGDGNIYTTGNFYDTADFDPGINTVNLIATGSSADIFILKLSPLGDYVWAGSIGETGDDLGNCITVDDACNIYTTGYYLDTADFDTGTGTNTLFNNGGGQSYALKLSCQLTTGLDDDVFSNYSLSIYPNPTSSQLTINYEGEISEINIIDIKGKTIKQFSSAKTIEVADLVAGVYFLQIKSDRNVINRKFIKE